MTAVSFENNFDLSKLVKEKFVVLVRDNVIYGYYAHHFSLIMAKSSVETKYIRTNEILPNDILYAFDKPEDIYLTLKAGNCLDEYLAKNEESRFDKVTKLLKEGYFVGAIYNTTSRTHNAKSRVTADYENFSVYNKNGEKLDTFLRRLGKSSSINHSEFFITKNEFEFWKWLNS
jgi:CTP:phosphocholine cytidylyltransferase-like protein